MNNSARYLLAPWHKKRNLEYLYIELGYSTPDIAKFYGCDPTTIRKWMIKHNIPRRSCAGTATKYNKKMYRNRHYLRQQYLILKLSTEEIARKEKVSSTSVRTWMKKFNIPARQGMNQYTMRKLKESV